MKNLELFFEDAECNILEDSNFAFIFILHGNSFVCEHCNNITIAGWIEKGVELAQLGKKKSFCNTVVNTDLY